MARRKLKKWVTVSAYDKHNKKYAKILIHMFNRYITDHEEAILSAVWKQWYEQTILGTTVAEIDENYSPGGTI